MKKLLLLPLLIFLVLPNLSLAQTIPLYTRYGISTTPLPNNVPFTDEVIVGPDDPNADTDLAENKINIVVLGDGYGNTSLPWDQVAESDQILEDFGSFENDPLYRFLSGTDVPAELNDRDGVCGYRDALFLTTPYMEYKNFFHMVAVFVDNTNYASTEYNGIGVNEPCSSSDHCEFSGQNFVQYDDPDGTDNCASSMILNHWGTTFDTGGLHRYQTVRDQDNPSPFDDYSRERVIEEVQTLSSGYLSGSHFLPKRSVIQ